MREWSRNTPEKFWSLVDQKGPKDCWLWTGKLNHDGYAQFFWKGRLQMVARIAFELHYEKKLPTRKRKDGSRGLLVRHSCDNPQCVNPAHLILGTQIDNMRDRTIRGRVPRFNNHPHAKLTFAAVRNIRKSSKPQKVLARIYGVVPNVIWKIKHNYVWKETEYPKDQLT